MQPQGVFSTRSLTGLEGITVDGFTIEKLGVPENKIKNIIYKEWKEEDVEAKFSYVVDLNQIGMPRTHALKVTYELRTKEEGGSTINWITVSVERKREVYVANAILGERIVQGDKKRAKDLSNSVEIEVFGGGEDSYIESNIKEDNEITGKVVYLSKGNKQKKLAIYFFIFLIGMIGIYGLVRND